ncbi:MAG: amidohydrolase [Anaerolineae bacterium]|nr:amidohydrolase [Anaerolineae bacterium]
MIIDAHAHVYPAVHGLIGDGATRSMGYGRIAIGDNVVQSLPPLCERTTYTPEMLIAQMDWAGVQRAVLLQGPFYGECNDYARAAIQRYPDRLVGMAYLDPWSPDPQQFFENTFAEPCFKGVKLECSEAAGLCGLHPDARLDSPELGWLWDTLEQRGLLLTLDLGAVGSRSYQTQAVRAIAETHPNLKIVIAHLAQPTPAVEADPQRWQQWQDQIDLGCLPNVWFDTAALPAYLPDEDYSYPTAGRYIRIAIERIGPQKVIWGTDQPGLLGQATYPQLVKMARLHTQFLAPREQALVLADNAILVYGC